VDANTSVLAKKGNRILQEMKDSNKECRSKETASLERVTRR
jgi:hypothetical protein